MKFLVLFLGKGLVDMTENIELGKDEMYDNRKCHRNRILNTYITR